MKLRNVSKKTLLASECSVCKSVLCKSLGLMFSQKKHKKALMFIFSSERIVSLHMFFVFYSIDVMYLDKKKKVIEIKEGLLPFHLHFPKKKALYVVEVPSGRIRESKTRVGDVISFT